MTDKIEWSVRNVLSVGFNSFSLVATIALAMHIVDSIGLVEVLVIPIGIIILGLTGIPAANSAGDMFFESGESE